MGIHVLISCVLRKVTKPLWVLVPISGKLLHRVATRIRLGIMHAKHLEICLAYRFWHYHYSVQFISVQSLSPVWLFMTHRLQHGSLPCPSPTPGACSNSCHWVGDAIQPSHPLLSLSPPALNLSQNQSLFKWVSSSYEVAKVLEFQLQHQSFRWIFRTDFL